VKVSFTFAACGEGKKRRGYYKLEKKRVPTKETRRREEKNDCEGSTNAKRSARGAISSKGDEGEKHPKGRMDTPEGEPSNSRKVGGLSVL